MVDPRPDDDRSDYDLVREHVEGSLGPAQTEALLARARLDAELGESLEAFRAVTRALGGPPLPPPARSVSLEGMQAALLLRESRRRHAHAWGLGIAALVLFALGAWVGASASAGPAAAETVELVALAALPAADARDAETEALLASLDLLAERGTAPDGDVRWLASLADGRNVARATGRPILFFLYHPVCPICAELEAGPLADAAVRRAIGAFVPVRILASFDEPDPAVDRDWPYLAVASPDGVVLDELRVPAETAEVLAFLADQTARRVSPRAHSWAHVRRLAHRLRDTRGASLAAREALPLLDALADDPEAGVFARAARRTASDFHRSAYEALREAAVASATVPDPTVARRVLEEACTRFAGTSVGADVANVLAALVRTGRFPRVTPPPLAALPPR